MEPQTRTLLNKSAGDRVALDHEGLAPDILGFHAQQALEKLLKALLNEAGVVFPRIHDLAALARLVATHDQAPPSLAFTWKQLTDFAVGYRYEELPEAEEPDPADLRATVDTLRAHVEARIHALAAAKLPPAGPPSSPQI